MGRDEGRVELTEAMILEMGCTSRSSRKVSWRLCISENGRNEGGSRGVKSRGVV